MLTELDDSAHLWRYLDLDKFERLLASRALYCPKPSSFEDPWEGRLPRSEDEAQIQTHLAQLRSMGALDGKTDTELEEAVALYRRSDLSFDRNRYVSCWHINEGESAAMWDLYCSRDKGIAIVTTVQAMRSLAKRNEDLRAVFAPVEYLDYQTESVLGAGRDPIFCKRKSFEHEREARLVCLPQTESVSETHFRIKESIQLPIEPELFVSEIYISPIASQDFEITVRRCIKEAGLEILTTKSDLYSPY